MSACLMFIAHPKTAEKHVILNSFQDLIGLVAIIWRFRNKFGMTRREVFG